MVMSGHLEVTAETAITIKMDGEYARKLNRSLGKALDSFGGLPATTRGRLATEGVIDNLLALHTALIRALE
jgi:hypothetical protein